MSNLLVPTGGEWLCHDPPVLPSRDPPVLPSRDVPVIPSPPLLLPASATILAPNPASSSSLCACLIVRSMPLRDITPSTKEGTLVSLLMLVPLERMSWVGGGRG